MSIDTGWPSIAASASMPPTPHPARPDVDHRGVGVGAHERVGIGLAVADEDHRREPLEVDLVDDAVSGGTTLKSSKAVWPHFRNS
jgi:hypothetical protein